LRRTLEWRLIFLSSGEVSIADHVAQSGKRVRAGQEVRVINLPADAETGLGLFEELHGFSTPDGFARHLQRASRDYYGAPIRAFLRRLVGQIDELRRRYQIFEAELLAEMLPENAASEVSRVAHRFALVAFAGELATDYGITGWQPEDATAAAKAIFQAWLEARGTAGGADEEAALRQVRRFLERHGQSRFQHLGKQTEKIVDRAGYVEEADDDGLIYYVLPEVFRAEVCAGFDHKIVAKALNHHECLLVSHDLRYEKRLPEGKKKVYAILSRVLE
jgi:putative DNA primase/helicase